MLTAERAALLEPLLTASSEPVLLIADDHAYGLTTQAPLLLAPGSSPWLVVRSLNKALGPDLRLAVVAGDEQTITRIDGLIAVSAGWVSRTLQATGAAALTEKSIVKRVGLAAHQYDVRRQFTLEALAQVGLVAAGNSGINVWLPVDSEDRAISQVRNAGFDLRRGQHFRLTSPPAIRITTSTITLSEARDVANALASRAEHSTGRLG
jgi:DNA-binding transcriptional MocR family regulator